MNRSWGPSCPCLLAIGVVFGLGGFSAHRAYGGAGATNPPPARVSQTNAAPIAPAEAATEAEAAVSSLQSIEANLSADQVTPVVRGQLPALMAETSVRLQESSRILSSGPSLESLRHLDQEWQGTREQLGDWKSSLTKRVTQLAQQAQQLTQMQQRWQATRSAETSSQLPKELVERVDRVVSGVTEARQKVQAQEMEVLALQTLVSEQEEQVVRELSAIQSARETYIQNLLVRDSAPVWSMDLWSGSATNVVQQSGYSFSRQVQGLNHYAQRRAGGFALQVLLFLGLWFALTRARLALHGGTSEGRAAASPIFTYPMATALALALLASGWIYPHAPRLVWAICGAAALLPMSVLVRKLIDPRLVPVLNALVIFYFVDQLRVVAASQALVSRALFLLELLAGAAFTAWLLTTDRLASVPGPQRRWNAVKTGCKVALGIFVGALVLNCAGYLRLSRLVGHGLLQSAYMALLLYALVEILEGLFLMVLSVPCLARLGLVQRHRDLLENQTRAVLRWLAVLLWIVYVLEVFLLRAPVFEDLKDALTYTWHKGGFKISVGDVLEFGLTVWAAFQISRILRFVLEEEVYPRVRLAPGLYYSISKMVNYAVLLVGFFIGVTLLGFNLTHLTILVGAFGVGLGFGLQNIINNFVSGLILLFERPIKVGDVVQLSGNEGVVKHIGIRASIVRLTNGSEQIVPNGSFISETVTNWTFSDNLRRIDMPVAVGGAVDAREVVGLLTNAAAQHPKVVKEPPAQALLMNFAGDSANLELRFWTNQTEDWFQIRSDVAIAVRAALAERHVAIK